ncbi:MULTISPECIES: DUF736 domain-containing protein [Brucella]|uniref:DUF736 domain-containing protein n=1 Tax=Brucella tritici TaxID=94626 RepID=A0A6L3YD50_9HYPH|nr:MULTISPECIES: DUF736 domain-containing protein [Brucella]KAB2681155.1 DUF736 domain-containing protein [Brucella tritici]KAB2757363.1 DUF736 domain-containing protein [Brucella anthropi]KAB2775292.1 DUF736 domain-containing protein [Brucella anthropi]
MAKIGYLARKDNGHYEGRLQTLTLDVAIRLLPLEKTKSTAPDYRLMAGRAEVGAAWIKQSNSSGEEYVSLSIDTPELPSKINANLGKMDDLDEPEVFAIIWNRPK